MWSESPTKLFFLAKNNTWLTSSTQNSKIPENSRKMSHLSSGVVHLALERLVYIIVITDVIIIWIIFAIIIIYISVITYWIIIWIIFHINIFLIFFCFCIIRWPQRNINWLDLLFLSLDNWTAYYSWIFLRSLLFYNNLVVVFIFILGFNMNLNWTTFVTIV